MSGLEAHLAAAGFRILGEELVERIKNRGENLTEDGWAELGHFVDRKLRVDYENIEASRLTKSRKRTVVDKIESSAEIYRELALVGDKRNFDESVVKIGLCTRIALEQTSTMNGQKNTLKCRNDIER
jgi:hypothetical protein